MQTGPELNSLNASMSGVRYRVVYDTLSRLSCNINKCNSIGLVTSCLESELKYLFDNICIKFSFLELPLIQTFFAARNSIVGGQISDDFKTTILPIEEEVGTTQIAQYLTSEQEIARIYGETIDDSVRSELHAVWLFPFKMGNARLTVTVFSGKKYMLKNADVPVLKITCETFFAKAVSLQMLEETLDSRESLKLAYADVEAKNKKIERLIETQEEIIKVRTEEIRKQNAKLREVVRLNAHSIREPLTRIMGLIELSAHLRPEEVNNEILPAVYSSCKDLDKMIKRAVVFIEKE